MGDFPENLTKVLELFVLAILVSCMVVFYFEVDWGKPKNILDDHPPKEGDREKPRRAPRGGPFRRGKDS